MPSLTPGATQELLRIARVSIEEALRGRRFKPERPKDPALLKPAGAFVTLREAGSLRGCIGTLQASGPLYETVARMARSAAFEDPRFSVLREEEWPGVELEISVLSPLEEIDDPSRVEVGRHGLYVEQGAFRGVLLPQVATEQGWDRFRFLEETCRKAGLPRDAWKAGSRLYVFEAEILGA